MDYKFYRINIANINVAFICVFDGEMYRYDIDAPAVHSLHHTGSWRHEHDEFVHSGLWVEISPYEAKGILPIGYQDNFPFPQAFR